MPDHRNAGALGRSPQQPAVLRTITDRPAAA